ncbi:MAG: T9SS type A sorting domain-containing protein [Cytophagaceae bacterium]|nr:T9SS type A sorting domain-containing protein [Cytophagaceae bacterium]
MKSPIFLLLFSFFYFQLSAQTLTVNSGNSPYTISSNITYTSVTVTGGGNLIINSGVTLTITGTTGPLFTISSNGTAVDNNGTIVVGNIGNSAANTVMTMTQGSVLNMPAGSLLTVNGSFTTANSAALEIDGAIQVNGNFTSNNTSAINGSGSINTTGTLITNNTSTVFGSGGNCNTGPCSGSNLCGFTVSISANQSICSGTTAAILTSSTTAVSPTYRWQSSTTGVPSSFANATGTNTNATYAPGALAATRWYRLQVTSGGCTQYGNTIKVTVNTTGAASVSVTASSTSICAGTNVTFTATPTNGGTAPSYQWKLNNVNVGTNSATYSNSSLNNGDVVRCVMTSNYTCLGANPSVVNSNSITMVVNPYQTPSVSISASATTVCTGTNVTFTATPVNGGTPPSYQWKRNGANVGTNSAIYNSSTLANNDVISCVMTSTYACPNAPTATSNSITMTINTTPAITTQPANQTVCEGSTATFNVTATGTNLNYQWRKNGVNITGANSSSYTTPALGTGDGGDTYSVVISNTGCALRTSNNATLTVNTPPTFIIDPTNQAVCSGNGAVFFAIAWGSGTTYQWRKDGVNISGATAFIYVIGTTNAGHAGTYDVVATRNGCSAISAPATLSINTAPVITLQPVSQGVCVGSTATFSVAATSGATLTYQWRKNGTNISGATASSYTTPATVIGDNGALYSVVITNTCGNITSSNATLTVTTPTTISLQPASISKCLGAAANFTVTAAGTGLTYQWRKNGSNISGATSATYSIASTVSTDAANYDVVITRSGCSVTSNTASLTITTTNIWLGVTSTDWFNQTNWGCGIIPTTNLDAIIPASLLTYPNVNGTANAKSITIATTGSVTMANGSSLNVAGDFTNNGTFTSNTSAVSFNGSAAQVINGSSATTFSSLNINNTTGVSIAKDANLTSELTLGANAKFTTTGFVFTLVSTASATASIAAIPASATFTGNIRMQRYIPPSGRYWYHLSSPVSTGTVAQWQTGAPTGGFYVTGPFTGASNPGNGVVKTGVSAYSWNAATATWTGFPVSSNTEVIQPRAGYRVFIRDGNAAYNGGNTTAKTFSLIGPPNTGDQTFSLPYSPTGGNPAGGWNLIGNPYPSNINGNLNNSAWTTKSNLDGFATYMWDSDQRRYVSCNGGLGSCVIPSSQAFWVKVNPGGGTLVASENVKTTGSLALYKKSATTANYIPVVLTNLQYGEKDVTYLRFEDDATGNFDNQYDAYKLDVVSTGTSSSYVLVSSIMDNNNTELSINARTTPAVNDTIPLNVGGYDGSHTLDFSDRTSLSDDYNMLLIDKYTNTVTDIDQNPVYTFSIQSTIAATAGKRFKIVFSYTPENLTAVTPAASVKTLNIYPNPASTGYFIININQNNDDVKVTICNMLGHQVFEKNYSGKDQIKVEFNKTLPAGTYVVTVKTGEDISRSKLVVE